VASKPREVTPVQDTDGAPAEVEAVDEKEGLLKEKRRLYFIERVQLRFPSRGTQEGVESMCAQPDAVRVNIHRRKLALETDHLRAVRQAWHARRRVRSLAISPAIGTRSREIHGEGLTMLQMRISNRAYCSESQGAPRNWTAFLPKRLLELVFWSISFRDVTRGRPTNGYMIQRKQLQPGE
jgi:hypothetical protein